MSLYALPNELLELVVTYLHGSHYENSMLSSKTLYAAGKKLMKERSALRRRWRKFAYTTPVSRPRKSGGLYRDWGSDPIRSSLELCLHIAKEPFIAEYIEAADLSCDVPCDDIGNSRSSIIRTRQELADLDRAGSNVLRRLISSSPYLKEAEVNPKEYYNKMIEAYEMADYCFDATILLFTLLSDLKSLVLPTYWHHLDSSSFDDERDDSRWKVLDLIVRKSNRKAVSRPSRLTAVHSLMEPGYDERVSLQAMAPFLSVNSVRSFFGASIVAHSDTVTGMKFSPRYDSFGVGLERIDLRCSCIDAEHIAKVLGTSPKLKVFNFTYETKWHGCGYHWDAGHFVAAIESAVGKSLEELSVSVHKCSGSLGTAIASLKGFLQLRKLELSTNMLHGPPHGGEVDRVWYGTTREDCKRDGKCLYCTGETAKGPKEVRSLTALAPSSVEIVRLLVDGHGESCETVYSLLHGAGAANFEEALPNLRKIELFGPESTVFSTMKKPACQSLFRKVNSMGDMVEWITMSEGEEPQFVKESSMRKLKDFQRRTEESPERAEVLALK